MSTIKKAPPRKGQFDLNAAINEIIVLGRSAIIKNGVSVQTRLSEGFIPIHGDRVQLQQVVLNLLLNAVEAIATLCGGDRGSSGSPVIFRSALSSYPNGLGAELP